MLYFLAHILREKCEWLWDLLEWVNSVLFVILNRRKLKSVPAVIESHSCNGLEMHLLREEEVPALAEFFRQQPEHAFEYFRPHGFDEAMLGKLCRRQSFIMAVCVYKGQIVGYFFLRSFVHRKSYLGKMVDVGMQGKGIAKVMCKAAMDVAVALDMHMYESINRTNVASMRSSASVLKQVIQRDLGGGDLLIEDLPLP